MRAVSLPGSCHVFRPSALTGPTITLWAVFLGPDELGGCGALRDLGDQSGEIKSMRTVEVHRGAGVASRLLRHMFEVAAERRYRRLFLETGGWADFAPARALYRKHGFVPCAPFGDYGDDPNSCFMTRELLR